MEIMRKILPVIFTAFMIQVFLPHSSSSEAEPISLRALWRYYVALDEKIKECAKEADRLGNTRNELPVHFKLRDKVEELQVEQEWLEGHLEKAIALHEKALPDFEIVAFVKGPDGKLKGLKKDKYVSTGDEVTFYANVPHPESETPVPTTLFWQVYTEDEEPIEGAGKQINAAESGGTNTYNFTLSVTDVPPGTYIVALTHALLSDENVRTQAQYPVKVLDVANIEEIIITDSPGELKNKTLIQNDKKPYFYVNCGLIEGIKSVKLEMILTDPGTGRILATLDPREVPVKGDPARQVYVLTMEPGEIPPDTEARLTVKLTTPDGKVKTASSDFTTGWYELELALPSEIKVDDEKGFRIIVPGEFISPYKVDIEHSSSLSIGRKPGALKGTVSGIAEKKPVTARFSATVTDAEGKTGKISRSIKVIPKTRPKPKKVEAPKAEPAPAVSGSEEVEWKEYRNSSGRLYQKSQVKKGTKIRHGKTYLYHSNGNISDESHYVNDKKNGPSTSYYKNGQVSLTVSYVNDERNGVRYSYYENGAKRGIATFKNDIAVGEATKWHKNGVVASKSRYAPKNGALIFWAHYDENGKCYASSDHSIVEK
jgi:antitoxin component YwqK of YwqJK toxin-antitoxin module